MNGSPSGFSFSNAPVTRAFFIASALFTVFFGIKGDSSNLGLSYQDIFDKFGIWKLIIWNFAFSSTSELLYGLCLLHCFRVFERQIGSNKHSVFILFSGIVSLILETILLSLFKDNLVTSGPYALIFASFVPFYLDIPVARRYQLFGVHYSYKSFIYLGGLQLLLSSWKRSIIPGICGIIAGSLYRFNIFGIRNAKFPEFIASFFSQLSLPSLSSSHSQAPRRTSPNLGHQAVRSNRAPVPSSSIEPPMEAIGTLVLMGFDQNEARQTLLDARNDLNAATFSKHIMKIAETYC